MLHPIFTKPLIIDADSQQQPEGFVITPQIGKIINLLSPDSLNERDGCWRG
jgi:hypothetical protein